MRSTIKTIILTVIVYCLGYSSGFTTGRKAAEHAHEARKHEHDEQMRKIGVCRWAKVIASQVECGGTEHTINMTPHECEAGKSKNCV